MAVDPYFEELASITLDRAAKSLLPEAQTELTAGTTIQMQL